MVTLGIANSRLKDFYDLWLISRTFAFDFSGLSNAVQRTFARRNTPLPTKIPTGLTQQYAEEWNTRWKAYLKREHMQAVPDDLSILMEEIREFFVPIISLSFQRAHRKAGGLWLVNSD
jgi:hypothetical protein